MTEYYFTGTYLPSLRIGEIPEIPFEDFENLLNDNLTEEDLLQVAVLRRYHDLQNVRRFWLGEELDPYGNLNEKELEEALVNPGIFPQYVYDFLQKYDSKEARLEHFPALIAAYFKEEVIRSEGFLKEYLAFERALRLVFLGFRAKKLGRNLTEELKYEDPEDILVAQILAQKDSAHYEPPSGFEDLKHIFEEYGNRPMELHKRLIEYRFDNIETLIGLKVFTIDRILAYLVQFIFAEQWLKLDRQKGMQIVDSIVKGIV